MPNLGPLEIIIIAGVIILLFGAKKLPEAARSLGRSMRIFKSEVKEMSNDDAQQQTPQLTQQPQPTYPQVQQPQVDAQNYAAPQPHYQQPHEPVPPQAYPQQQQPQQPAPGYQPQQQTYPQPEYPQQPHPNQNPGYPPQQPQ